MAEDLASLSRLVEVGQRGELFELDLDGLGCPARSLAGSGGHHCDGLAPVSDLTVREDRLIPYRLPLES